MKIYVKIIVSSVFCLIIGNSLSASRAVAAVLNDYCNVPPFVAQSVPPLVLLTSGRDHKFYYEAFNEAMDLDEDGRVDIGYMHNIDYYGYFDSYKCYTYNNATGLFSPATTTADKFCVANQWSGNILNWLAMSRMDVLRKVLYGGHRSTDTTTSTILERTYVPGDAHSWAKEIPGGLCRNGSVYKNTCYNDSDCDTGYTCTDKSLNLIGMARATYSVCPATAVTWSSTTAGKIMVSKFWATDGGAVNGPTHAELLKSFYTDATNNTVSPLSLIDMSASGNPAGTSGMVKYINNFNDASVDPATDKEAYTNLLAVTAFTTANNTAMTGIWQFAVDGDDGVEVEILPANKLPTNPASWIVANYYGAHGACFLPSATASPNNTALCTLSQSSRNNGFFNSTLAAGSKVWSKTPGTSCAVANDAAGTAAQGYCVNGGISLVANTKYYMIVRQTNGTGHGGVRVWYRTPSAGPAAWTIFGADSNLTLSSPTIASGNECSIRFKAFVDLADTTTGENRQHLICSTTRSVAGTPVLRLLKDRIERKWNWASKERPDCADVIRKIDDSADIALTVDATKTDATKIWDYTVRNEVCLNVAPDNRPAAKQDASASGKETNCRPYKSGATTTYKPSGLLQKYGEGDGSKVCSRTYSKPCTTDADCTNISPAFEGLCIDKAPMYFGLITGSYVKNLSGGVLHKDIWSLSDEINMATGQFIVPPAATAASFAATFPQGGIIPTFEALRTVGFQYSDNSYQDTVDPNNGGACGWILNNPLPEGNCRMWGNPIGEMMYEGLRYLAGKTAPTAEFVGAAQDGSLPIYRQDWGVVRGANTFRPYGDKDNAYPIFPACSKPFMLVLSDENVSYDSDMLPGSKFSTFAEDAGLPKLNINVETMANIIGGPVSSGGEGIDGSDVFIGQNNTVNDFICSVKGPSSTPSVATKLSLLRGLCPEEPTKQGSYYSAAVALYGKTLFNANTGKPNVSTYSVVMTSPVPKMTIRVNNKDVVLVPMAKSTSGGGVETSCANRCTLSINALGSLVISGCSTPASVSSTGTVTAGSFCPTNQIVDFYVDTVLYDNNNAPPYTSSNPAPNITYAKFRINFEDVEQGADHDMDAISIFEICTGTTCSPDLTDPNQVKVTVTSVYAAGGINQVMGFIISGTTENGPYLVVRDSDSSTTCSSNPGACNLPLSWTHTFTATGTTANLLQRPLWYAAKWGGFNDGNGNNLPDVVGEWAKNDGINPDNYYLVVNPLKLETQLDKALTDILAKTSSGTAASIVNNKGSSGANLITAVFHPQKDLENKQTLTWAGDMQNLWYYFDPFLTNSTIREDTNQDKILNLTDDYKLDFNFDTSLGKTVVKRSRDNGKGTYTAIDTLDNTEDVKALWSAGDRLFLRTASDRTIYYNTGSTLATLPYAATPAPSATLQIYLQAASAAEATKTIQYVYGVDDATLRNRSVTISRLASTKKVWKLGDIVTSTPKVQGASPLGGYHLDYADNSYSNFIATSAYGQRGMVYAGGNDGMLHAFNLGKVTNLSSGYQKAQLTNTSAKTLGEEEWGFIPYHVMPYLKYLGDPAYNHLYMVDNTTLIEDVSIIRPSSYTSDSTTDRSGYSGCGETNAYDCVKDISSWRTILIGGMGLGGASRANNGTCAATNSPPTPAVGDCVKAPLTTASYQNVGLSSYFALDITTPTAPSLMWEFPSPFNATHATALGALGYTISEPVIVRVNSTSNTCNSSTPGCTAFEKSAQGKNGRWLAIFVSGPTGPIATGSHQFYGRSDQSLKIFVVDVATGNLLKTFDAGTGAGKLNLISWKNAAGATVDYSFGGSVATNAFDTDKWDKTRAGSYSTDVVYIGYVKGKAVNGVNTFSDGGVLRLNTNDDLDPNHWELSKLIDNTGPVTASMDVMYNDMYSYTPSDKSIPKVPVMWLYFGTGRYHYKDAMAGIDTQRDQEALYGVKEPCYSVAAADSDSAAVKALKLSHTKDMMPNTIVDASNGCNLTVTHSPLVCSESATKFCNSSADCTGTCSRATSSLKDQSSTPSATLAADRAGWYINLDTSKVCSENATKSCFSNVDCTGTCASGGSYASERSITTPSARTNGMVQFTTFKPTADICGFGGETMFWFVKDETGGAADLATLKGKITIQLSTGAIVVVDLSKIKETTIGDPKTRVLEYTDSTGVVRTLQLGREGRQLDVGAGKPPSPKPPADTLKKPVRQILHVQEK